jgi:hypothetical protein
MMTRKLPVVELSEAPRCEYHDCNLGHPLSEGPASEIAIGGNEKVYTCCLCASPYVGFYRESTGFTPSIRQVVLKIIE